MVITWCYGSRDLRDRVMSFFYSTTNRRYVLYSDCDSQLLLQTQRREVLGVGQLGDGESLHNETVLHLIDTIET